MASLLLFTLLTISSSPGQPVLLDFYSESCAPCRLMEPTVRRLAADGYAVRQVDISREPDLARQFRVDQVPTFILVANDREIGRAVGTVSYERLRSLYEAVPAGGAPAANPPPQNPVQNPASVAEPAAASPPGGLNLQTRALYATVRLRVEDASGQSYGTGTIIDRHADAQGEEALVMTCAHLFRDSKGQGPINVDLVAPGAKNPVKGQLISYDLKQDVALVSIRPGIQVSPVVVAPAGYEVRTGDRVFSIGCDRGGDPSVHDSRVTALNKYVAPPNIEVAGAPVIGRSGGGLFSANGQLIGVCNLADPKDNEGIYAALPLLHQNLDKVGLSGVYRQSAPQVATTRGPAPAPNSDQLAADEPPPMPDRMPRAPRDNLAVPPAPTATGPSTAPWNAVSGVGMEDTEIICIVRSKTNPNSRNEVWVVDRPPRELLDRLAKESKSTSRNGRDPVVLQAARSDSPLGSAAPQRWSDTGNRTPIVRGQAY